MGYLIVFIVDQIEECPPVMDAWEEAGAAGITIFESTGLGRIRRKEGMRDDLPLMPSLRNLLQTQEERHRTLMTLVKDMETVDAIIAATEAAVGDLGQPNKGVLFVQEVIKVVGVAGWDEEG